MRGVAHRSQQTYGAVVADTTVAEWHLSDTPAERWDTDDLDTLGIFTPTDFEWLDVTTRTGTGASLETGDAGGR